MRKMALIALSSTCKLGGYRPGETSEVVSRQSHVPDETAQGRRSVLRYVSLSELPTFGRCVMQKLSCGLAGSRDCPKYWLLIGALMGRSRTISILKPQTLYPATWLA